VRSTSLLIRCLASPLHGGTNRIDQDAASDALTSVAPVFEFQRGIFAYALRESIKVRASEFAFDLDGYGNL